MDLETEFRSSGRGSRSFFCESVVSQTGRKVGSARPARSPIGVVGVSHRTATVDVREKLAASVPDHEGSLIPAIGPEWLAEMAIISTCNRFEVYYVPVCSLSKVEARLVKWFSQVCELPFAEVSQMTYRFTEQAAIRHLLRVACGLESQILGETQILGQVAGALARARSRGFVGPVLTYVLSRAVHTGKRARTETAISSGKVSISRAAACFLAEKLGGLSDKTVVLLGAGETAALVAEALRERSPGRTICVSRSLARARRLAEQMGFEESPWSTLGGLLARADALITATAAPHPVLRLEDLRPAVAERTGKPLVVVDIAVPRDVEESVRSLPGVEIIDIDDLETGLDENRLRRLAAVPDVEAIVSEETQQVIEWLHGRKVAPLIQQFRSRARLIADLEAQQVVNKLGSLAPREKELVVRLARQVANKILHEPTVRLKNLARERDGDRYVEFFVEIFGLNQAGRAEDEAI